MSGENIDGRQMKTTMKTREFNYYCDHQVHIQILTLQIVWRRPLCELVEFEIVLFDSFSNTPKAREIKTTLILLCDQQPRTFC